MRKQLSVTLSLVVLVSLVLAACGAIAPTPTLSRAELEATLNSMPTNTPAATSTPLPVLNPSTPVPTKDPLALPELLTAMQMRAFGKIKGWVSGGEGQWTAGAQVETKRDFALNTMPSGVVFEFQCVHYSVLSGQVIAKPVCDGAIVVFDSNSIVPAGSVGTFWFPWAVQGSTLEVWGEGFLNKPCLCAIGDCRKTP